MNLETLRIAVVGSGRVGHALVRAMRAAGLDVTGPVGRGATGAGFDLVFLAVPDRAIADAARLIESGRLVAHCSGATTLDALAPHEALSIHPLTTITGPESSLGGVGCAIAGSTPAALALADALARRLGMNPVSVAESDRDIYHAAASMASNYLVTLEDAAERLFAAAGVGGGRELVAPLVHAAVASWQSLGGERALTGPIARGDEETVGRQRAAVAARAPQLLPLWDALADATRALAARRQAGAGADARTGASR
jgi:predicted short-subunit dehydrogenase-like oxidoreductase (DUF2520 family)